MFNKRVVAQAFITYCGKKTRIAAAMVLAIAMQSHDLRADLLFRSVEYVGGQAAWSPARNYANPSDTASVRVLARGATAQEVRVILSGNISNADIDSAITMAGLLRSGKQKLAGNTVWFASNGGDIDTAMELGRLLRKAGIYTAIGRNDQCMSACVFAFMGGERRSVAGRLGIHRPFFPFTQETPDRYARFRYLQKVLKDYVEEMDFPVSLYEAVMLVPPETHQIVSPVDLKRFYLEGISPSTEDMVDAASARRLHISMAEYLKHKARAPACPFLEAAQGRCDGRVQELAASGGAADDLATMKGGEVNATGRAGTRATRMAQSQ
jgi:hypothetical protein